VQVENALKPVIVVVGTDGSFLEVRDNPAAALSDGTNSLPLAQLKATLEPLIAIRRALATKPLV
jgi:3-deoxy-D-manno-octulosonic acid (KDO) 8-phosphate synthase